MRGKHSFMKGISSILYFAIGFLILQGGISCKSDLNTDRINTSTSTNDPKTSPKVANAPLDTTNPDALYREAGKYFNNKQYGLAELYLKKAMKLKPNEPDYFMAMADLYMDQNNSRKAIDILEQGVNVAPRDTLIRLKQIQFLIITQQYADGIQKSADLLAMDPQNADAYFLRGLIFKETDNDSLARINFQHAVDLDPKLTDAYINLGDLYSKDNDPLALKYYQNALAFDDKNPIAKHSIAYYYQNHNQIDKAIELYQDIEKVTPGYPDAYLNLGIIFMTQDKIPEAYEQFSKFIELDDQAPEGYYYRSLAAEQLGMPQKALFDMKEAVSIDPKFEKAQKELKRLVHKKQ